MKKFYSAEFEEMKLDKQNFKKLAAYFSGNLNDEEKREVEQWKNASTDNKKSFNEIRQIWENSAIRLQVKDEETHQEWLRLKSTLENDLSGKRPERRMTGKTGIALVAGIMLLALSVYVFWPSKTMITISSGNEVATVYLPDSSQVWLNVGSTLIYSEDFGEQLREVRLSGEGYFMVRSDTARPFMVHSALASATVPGTSFNLREDSTGAILVVAEGKVSFSYSGDKAEKLIVAADQMAVVNNNGELSKSAIKDYNYSTWRKSNNPLYDLEKQNPSAYLFNNFNWEKNKINLSVIEGTLKNSARLAIYSNIVLDISYTKPNGNVATKRLIIPETVQPGDVIPYKKRLFDIFTNTQKVEVEVVSAEVVKR